MTENEPLPVKRPRYEEAYEVWRTDPSPENLGKVVDTLSPVVDFAVVSSGSLDNPLVRNQAKIYTAEAVKAYDPAHGSSLPTWTSRQLMRLRRFKRAQSQPLKVGDRAVLDAWHLHQKEQEFIDENDREPDLEELADLSNIPRKRIEDLRRKMRPAVSEAAAAAAGYGGVTQPEFSDEALEYVYQDADYTDRKILEMRLGYGGKYTSLPATEVAAKLKIHPSQVSRRAARLAYRIHKMEADLEKL